MLVMTHIVIDSVFPNNSFPHVYPIPSTVTRKTWTLALALP